jgi:hypothetical protein
MKARPIIPRYEMIAIALVILAAIVFGMLQEGTWLSKMLAGTCGGNDCPPPIPALPLGGA